MTNIIACIITTLYVIAGGSLMLHYLFFAAAEITAMLLILRSAWKWTGTETISETKNNERRIVL